MINFIKNGENTKDATATPDDILSPKTAYVNGEKITGAIQSNYEDTGATVINKVLDAPKIFSIRDNRLIIYNHTEKQFELYSYVNNSISLLDSIDCSSIENMPSSFVEGTYMDIGCQENNIRYACY